jgi:mono/diheme cytochrome c family protein
MDKRTATMTKRAATFLILPAILWGAASVASTPPARGPAPAPATATAPATKPAAGRTTADGVYNAAQLARGKAAYLISCARCHGETLLGNDDAVPLVGDAFVKEWTGESVGKLVEYTRTQMPSDGPGRMTRKEITDIVVYLLNANGLPEGKAELSSELNDLNGILIQVKK